jgi:mRNA interferase MazF
MKRGEIWTVSGGAGYAGKPRPALILQDDRFDGTSSVTLCAFTTDPTDAPLFRLVISPDDTNGLRENCRLMQTRSRPYPNRGLVRLSAAWAKAIWPASTGR